MNGIFAPSTISEHVRNKTPLWGKTNVDWSWDSAIEFLDTHPDKLCNPHAEKVRIFLKECQLRPSSPEFAQGIIRDMKDVFHQNIITNFMFYGFGKDCGSYPWHKDRMDVFLVQVLGDVSIRVENTEYEDNPKQFTQGECVYIPRGTHHQIISGKSRVTFSFGVEREPDPSTYI